MPTGSINTGLEYALFSKVLDTAEDTGAALAKMMEASVSGIGRNMDVRA